MYTLDDEERRLFQFLRVVELIGVLGHQALRRVSASKPIFEHFLQVFLCNLERIAIEVVFFVDGGVDDVFALDVQVQLFYDKK